MKPYIDEHIVANMVRMRSARNRMAIVALVPLGITYASAVASGTYHLYRMVPARTDDVARLANDLLISSGWRGRHTSIAGIVELVPPEAAYIEPTASDDLAPEGGSRGSAGRDAAPAPNSRMLDALRAAQIIHDTMKETIGSDAVQLIRLAREGAMFGENNGGNPQGSN